MLRSRTLFAFGSNGNGQLGIGSDEDKSIPQPVTFIPPPPPYHASITDTNATHATHAPFHDFAVGGNHTALITHGEQTLYMTGTNKDNESLLPEPVQVFMAHTILPLYHSKDMERLQQERRWRSVACGWAFTIAVTEPQPSPTDNVASSETEQHVHCKNKVYAWGSGAFGELGLGPSLTKTGRRAIAIENGLLSTTSPSPSSTALSSGSFLDNFEILKVRAGLRHVLALAREKQGTRTLLMGWGSNRQGQLGILERQGDITTPFSEKELRGKFMEPTRILISSRDDAASGSAPEIVDMACGQNHSLVLLADGSVYSSGLNKYGQLGPNGTLEQDKRDFRIGFEKVHGLPFMNSISCGWNHCAAMDTRSSSTRTAIYLWGRSDHGQLGDHTASGIVQVRIPRSYSGEDSDGTGDTPCDHEPIVSYSCGSEHTLAMTDSGHCYAWGWNEHGNCGSDTNGSDDRQNVPSPREVHFPVLPPKNSACLESGQGWVAGGYGSSWVWT